MLSFVSYPVPLLPPELRPPLPAEPLAGLGKGLVGFWPGSLFEPLPLLLYVKTLYRNKPFIINITPNKNKIPKIIKCKLNNPNFSFKYAFKQSYLKIVWNNTLTKYLIKS